MSEELEHTFSCFTLQRVPPVWEAVAYPSLKPLAGWNVDLFNRLAFIEKWLTTGPPVCFWISGFFFPQGFMTSALQAYSRRYKLPVDLLGLTAVIKQTGPEEFDKPPNDGAYIYGLFMEGARFDREEMSIAESFPGELYDPPPVIHLFPKEGIIPLAACDDLGLGQYVCPMYKTSRRAGMLSTTGHSTNFVVALNIPSKKPQDYWIRRGVALLCMLDY